MTPLTPRPGLTEQVRQALQNAMTTGQLAPGQHLVQEQLAAGLGVSRQPVQQALALLKAEGLVVEQGKRGLFVAPLDAATMRHRYDIRAVLDGLAARRAAERAAADRTFAADLQLSGAERIAAGRAAITTGDVAAMVDCDIAFHDAIAAASGNPMLVETAALHWRQLRRVMGEVLRHASPPVALWNQHEVILEAVLAGDPARAEAAAIDHVWRASERLEQTLALRNPAPAPTAQASLRRTA